MTTESVDELRSIESRYLERIAASLRGRIISSYDYFDMLLQIVFAVHDSSNTVSVLLRNSIVWDCEPLLRMITEATLKFIYLCLGTEQEREAKYLEYTEILPAANSVRRHERVGKFLAFVKDAGSAEWLPLRELLLSPEQLEAIGKRFSNSRIRAAARNWSFQGLGQALAHNPKYQYLTNLAFGYGMSSHILHADSDGVSIRWERELRSEARRNSVHEAHAARIASDVLAHVGLLLVAAVHVVAMDKTIVKSYEKEARVFFNGMENVEQEWRKVEYGLSEQ